MALPPDLHMHTPLCRHAVGEPAEYAARAAALGLSEIGFSDHAPMQRDDFDDWRMRYDQLDDYASAVRRAQQQFTKLKIRLALEVDYLPGQEDWIRQLAGCQNWDYFIGSVHYVSDTFAVDDPRKLSEWRKRDPLEVWSIYFERLTAAADSGLFDIIGHADLPKKFGFRPRSDLSSAQQRFLEAARRRGCAIELNTAGLRKECGEIYPGPDFLRLAFKLGVPITFGSDAHAPDEVGMNWAEAISLARSIGYTRCCRFEKRTRELIAL